MNAKILPKRLPGLAWILAFAAGTRLLYLLGFRSDVCAVISAAAAAPPAWLPPANTMIQMVTPRKPRRTGT